MCLTRGCNKGVVCGRGSTPPGPKASSGSQHEVVEMYSMQSCMSVGLFVHGGSYVIITHDALDITVQSPNPWPAL